MSDQENNCQIDEAINERENVMLARGAQAVLGLAALLVISFLGWLTSEAIESREFRSLGDRYTKHDAAIDRAEIIEKMSALPQPETREDISTLQRDVKTLSEDVARLQVILERIEKKM